MRHAIRRQHGYTLAEILVVVAVSSIVMIVAYDLIESAMRTSLFVESHNNLAQLAQRPVNFMQGEVYQNKIIFQADSAGIGNAYLTRFTTPPTYPGAWPSCGASGCGGPATTVPTMPPMQVNSLLPIVDTTNTLGPDPGTGAQRLTGNILFLVRQLPPLLIPYGSPTVFFPADRYRFELYYLTQNTTRPFYTSNYYVDLIQARSIDFADYFQLFPLIDNNGSPAFSPAQITQIINGLSAAGLGVAFDPTNQPVTNAFYKITSTGHMTLQSGQGIWIYQAKSLLPEFAGGSVSGKMVYTVGFRPSATTVFPTLSNYNTSSSSYVPKDPIPKFAIYDTSIPAFPSGFEVKLVGAGSAEKVLLRLVLLSNYGTSKMDSQEGMTIASAGSS